MKYINRLIKSQEGKLLNLLNFEVQSDGFCRGTEKIVKDDVVKFHSWNHDYGSSKDYVDDYISFNDFEVVSCLFDINRDDYTLILREYLSSLFGEQYKSDLKNYLNKKKEEINNKAIKNMNKIDKEIEMIK